jgi:mannose-6-phosphate isomerase-like protein (cupin superfamily)
VAKFETKSLPSACDVRAPDGAEVRLLLSLTGGSMAHFRLAPGETACAVRHRTVEEIWYVLSGAGELWRQSGTAEAVAALKPGVCATIPVGTAFQFRCLGTEPLDIVAVTLPPWPGDGEAVRVAGLWPPTAS